MSDSYTAWCEQNERNARLFSDENVKAVKSTKAFQAALKKAKEAAKSTKFCKAKSCENCAYNCYLNSKDVCIKLGIVLYRDCRVCSKWKKRKFENINGFTPKVNEDVIAWCLINKDKDCMQ